MSISTYTPDSNKILHTAYADFVSRQIDRPIHVVQYDDGLPVLSVKLFSDGQPYTIPSDADVSIKLSKSDSKFVYNPALGCDSARHIAYFEITYQMVILAEKVSPVIEVRVGTSVAASSSIGMIIDRNPIQREDIESTSEWKVIKQSIEYAKEAVTSAAQASASRSAALISANNAHTSEINAGTHASNASLSEVSAASSATEARDYAALSRSYTVGDLNVRPEECVDNAKYYYEQARRISEGLEGSLLPMGTISFSQLSTQTKSPGYMYNILDDFISDNNFKDGGGIPYPNGTNVYYTADGYWDCLSSTFVHGVKGNKELSYRKGNVNITPENIGASPENHVHEYAGSSSAGGSAMSSEKLKTSRKIFGKSFDGSSDVEGRGIFYGSHTDVPGDRFRLSALEIRENNSVSNTKSDIGYAPAIGFHWGNSIAATLLLHNDGKFYFRKQDGTSTATVVANLSGNADTATKATKDSDGQIINNVYLKKSDTQANININTIGVGAKKGYFANGRTLWDTLSYVQSGTVSSLGNGGWYNHTVVFPKAYENIPLISILPISGFSTENINLVSLSKSGIVFSVYGPTTTFPYGVKWIAVGNVSW